MAFQLNKSLFFLFIVFVMLSSFLFYGLVNQTHLIISDEFERMRMTNSIIGLHEFPEFNFSYGIPLRNVYAPLFDVLSGFLVIVSGLPLVIIWKIMSFMIFLVLFFSCFLIAKKYLPEKYAVITAGFSVLSIWIFRRILNPIPEILGLTFLMTTIYFLVKKQFKVIFLIMPFFALMHYRSFIVFFIIFICYSIYLLIKKEINLKKFSLPFVSLSLSLFWFLPRMNEMLSIHQINNPWIKILSINEVFPFIWLLGILGLLLTVHKKKLNLFTWLMIIGLIFWLITRNSLLGLRQLVYLFFPLAFFSAAFFNEIELKIKKLIKSKKEKILHETAFILAVIFLVVLMFSVFSILSEKSYFSNETINAIKELNEFNGKTVFTDFIGSYVVPAETSKTVIAGAFLEQLPDAESRAREQFNAFKKCSISTELIEKYDIDLIYLNHIWLSFGCRELKDKRFKLLWKKNNNWIYAVKK